MKTIGLHALHVLFPRPVNDLLCRCKKTRAHARLRGQATRGERRHLSARVFRSPAKVNLAHQGKIYNGF